MQLAIAFVLTDTTDSPNARVAPGGSPSDVYFRSMAVCFASTRRWNPDLRLTLVTTQEPPVRYSDLLERLGVLIEVTPFEHRPPAGYCERFLTSMFMLDALSSAAGRSTLFVDPDVLCIRPLERLTAAAGESVGALPMSYPPEHNINGLTRVAAAELHSQLGEPGDTPVHYGGECYLIPAGWQPAVAQRAERAWQISLDRFARGESRFTTEEHVLSFALRGVPVADLSSEVQRIWTASRYRTVTGFERDLSLWHLPAEKGRGFDQIFVALEHSDSWFWKAEWDDWVDSASKAMGLSRRPPQRFIRDVVGSSLQRLKTLRSS